MAAMFTLEVPDMHPQIANSFISLLASHGRASPRRRSWLARLFGRR